jgi:hypothetical protein
MYIMDFIQPLDTPERIQYYVHVDMCGYCLKKYLSCFAY